MLEKLMRRIPEADDEGLLVDLLEDAEKAILAYTGRRAVPEELQGVQLALAVIFYNRMGMEGETAHSEGGVSRTAVPLPEDIRRQLNPFRLAKAVGV